MIHRAAPLLLAGLLLTSCQGSKKKVIAVVPKGTSHLFWQSVQAGAIAAGRDLDVDILWNGPSQETEYSRQIQIVDSMVARHVDGLAVAATDNILTFVATNNYEGGQLAARKLAELIHGKGKVAMVMNAPGSGSTV